MQELKDALAREQPLINAEIRRRLEELPAPARPAAEHVMQGGGKRLRPLLTLLCGRAFGADGPDLYTLGAAVEMLHSATLLHDDILDRAETRRGRPAAHVLFGEGTVILAGDALLAKAMRLVSGLGDTRLTDCISEAVMRTAEGEIAEFALLRNRRATHSDYLAVVTGKTAWMLRAACELGALFAGADAPLAAAAAAFGLELGIAFQMVDDALDFSPEEITGKPRGGDLREGKITPPVLLYAASLPPEEAERFWCAFETGAFDETRTAAVSESLYSGGFANLARKAADPHTAKAGAELEKFPEGKERLVLRQMLGYIQNREK